MEQITEQTGRIHLFLTGRKGVGKSTLLKKLVDQISGPIGGFYTRKVWLPNAEGPTVHLLRAGTSEEPNANNLLFRCGDKSPATAQRFDVTAAAVLQEIGSSQLIVMDELGPHEAAATGFQRAVRHILDGTVPILGVLQEADSDFLQEIAAHPKVLVLRVTEENRDALREELLQKISE